MKRLVLPIRSVFVHASGHSRVLSYCVAGLFLGLLFSFGTGSRLAASLPDARKTDREAITKVLTGQQDTWNRGNVRAFLEGYWHSEELTFAGSTGVSRGWDAVLARYEKNYPDRTAMGTLDFSGLEFRFLGPDAALVLGRWHLEREKNDVGGVFSLVWQRFPEGWRIIHDHTSAVAETR